MSDELIGPGAAEDASALLKAGFRVLFWVDEATGERKCYSISQRATIVGELDGVRHVIVEGRS